MDPKGSAMENLLRGLSVLGPTISELAGQVGDLEKKVGGLSAIIAAKADQAAVEEISREVKEWRDAIPDLTENMKSTQTKLSNLEEMSNDFVHTSHMKAYAASIESFTEFTREVEKSELVQAEMFAQIEAIRDSVASKIDRGVVPSIEDFDDKGILMKTNRVEVPTFDQVTMLMQSQNEEMESKTKCVQVRLAGDVDELRQAISGKAEKDSTVSVEQFQEISGDVRKMDGEIQKLRSSMDDVSGVPGTLEKTIQVVEALKSKVDLKADEKLTQDQIRGINQILLPVARAVRSLPSVSSSIAVGVGGK